MNFALITDYDPPHPRTSSDQRPLGAKSLRTAMTIDPLILHGLLIDRDRLPIESALQVTRLDGAAAVSDTARMMVHAFP